MEGKKKPHLKPVFQSSQLKCPKPL